VKYRSSKLIFIIELQIKATTESEYYNYNYNCYTRKQ